jgi:hypothetical protein
MAPKVPSLRLVFHLEKVPASLGTTTYRWAVESLPDLEFTEGRIKDGSFATIEHALSSEDGHYAGASVRCVLDDQDGAIGALLGDESTEHFVGRDCSLELLSVEGRAAGLDWRPLFHGRVSDVQPGDDRTVTFEVRDLLSAEFAGISLDRPIGRVLIKDLGLTGTPASIENLMVPILIGEKSDKGTKDSEGNPAEQGVMPLKFVGYQRITDAGAIGGPGGPVYMGPPLNLIATYLGTAGTRTLYYAVSAITASGETIMSNVATVTNCADQLDTENRVVLSWDRPATYGSQVLHNRINGRESDPPTRYVQIVDDVTTFTDEGQDGENLPAAPEVSNAIVATPYGSGSEMAWGVMLHALGAVKPSALFFSDLGGEDEARASSGRHQLAMDDEDVLTPFLDDGTENPAWPFPDTSIELNGIRVTVTLVRGPRFQDHLDGKVTGAWNGCGWDADGDASWAGPVVNQPGEAIPLFVNEVLLKDGGVGYKTGDFGPLEAFPDGTAMINTGSFDVAQDLSKVWLGNSAGYLCQWYIDDTRKTWRQQLQELAVNFGWRFTAADYGQFWCSAIDDTADLTGAQHDREDIEIIDARLPPAEIRYTDIENRISYQYGSQPDQGTFRSTLRIIEDDEARIALKGPFKESGVIDLKCSDDRATCDDAMGRRLLHRRYSRRRAEVHRATGLADARGRRPRWLCRAAVFPHGPRVRAERQASHQDRDGHQPDPCGDEPDMVQR